jgi:hypothetical protein
VAPSPPLTPTYRLASRLHDDSVNAVVTDSKVACWRPPLLSHDTGMYRAPPGKTYAFGSTTSEK